MFDVLGSVARVHAIPTLFTAVATTTINAKILMQTTTSAP